MILTIFLPAYNEARVIGGVLEELPRQLAGFKKVQILVVDDGSKDDTASIARQYGAEVVRHQINRGVGLATITGLEAARFLKTDILVTMDSDGQHDPADIVKVIQPILAGTADFVLGTRLLHPKGMPWIKQIGNRTMNWFTQLFSGVKTTDSQSGFRAYNHYALERLHLTTSGYEVCTEIFVAAKQAGLRMAEVPIKVIYTDYSKHKGQSITNALNILVRLVIRSITR